MKCCLSTDSPDAGTGLLSPISYKRCNAQFYYFGKIPHICIVYENATYMYCGILLRRENPTYMYWPLVAAAKHGFKMVLFTASCENTFVGGTCGLPSALLVFLKFITLPFSELSMVDWPLTWLTNHCPSVLLHCWLGHVTRKVVSEMTYNVSSATLNPVPK